MSKNKQSKEQKPFFRIRSRFQPFVISYAHPVRLSISILIVLFMLPELAKLFGWMTGFGVTGIGGFFSYIFASIVVFLIALCGPLFMTWLDYKAIIYSFYDDRVEFIMGFWVREKLKIPYHAITDVLVITNKVQKKYKLGNIRLVAEPRLSGIKNKQQGHELPDIRNPQKVVANLEKLLNAHREKKRLERQV